MPRVELPTDRRFDRLAALSGIEQDLELVKECCSVIRSGALLQQPFLALVTEAIGTTALIRYGRCFANGRSGFTIQSEVMARQPRDLPRWHERFILLRDRHYAHAIGVAERNPVGADIEEGAGKTTVRRVTAGTVRLACIGSSEAARLGELCDAALGWVRSELLVEQERARKIAECMLLTGLDVPVMSIGSNGPWAELDRIIEQEKRRTRSKRNRI